MLTKVLSYPTTKTGSVLFSLPAIIDAQPSDRERPVFSLTGKQSLFGYNTDWNRCQDVHTE